MMILWMKGTGKRTQVSLTPLPSHVRNRNDDNDNDNDNDLRRDIVLSPLLPATSFMEKAL